MGLGRTAYVTAAESVVFIGGHPEHGGIRMCPFHARYPFFAATREAVESADVAITTLVAEDAPAIECDVERIEHVLMGDIIEPDPGEAYPRETKTELLSYLISCIIVPLIEAPAAVDKCARTEADTPYERMLVDFDVGDDDVHGEACVSLDGFLREFDPDDTVRVESNRNRNSRRAPDNY